MMGKYDASEVLVAVSSCPLPVAFSTNYLFMLQNILPSRHGLRPLATVVKIGWFGRQRVHGRRLDITI